MITANLCESMPWHHPVVLSFRTSILLEGSRMKRLWKVLAGIALAVVVALCGAFGLKALNTCDNYHSFFYDNPAQEQLPNALSRLANHQATDADRALITSLAQQLRNIMHDDQAQYGSKAEQAATALNNALTDNAFDQTKAADINRRLNDLNYAYVEQCSNISGQ